MDVSPDEPRRLPRTNNVYGAAIDEGLAFEIRIHGVPFMHPVLIPWRALRNAAAGRDILVVDENGRL